MKIFPCIECGEIHDSFLGYVCASCEFENEIENHLCPYDLEEKAEVDEYYFSYEKPEEKIPVLNDVL